MGSTCCWLPLPLLVSALPHRRRNLLMATIPGPEHIVFTNHLVPKILYVLPVVPLGWWFSYEGFEGSLGSVQSINTAKHAFASKISVT
jgi:hypothetical protein